MKLFGPWLMFDLTSSFHPESFTTSHHLHQPQHQAFGDDVLKAEESRASTEREIDEAPTVPHIHTTSFFCYLTISRAFRALF